jgi:hypothetical protein
MTSETGGVSQQRSESRDPAEDRDVVDLDAALDEQFLDVSVGQVNREYQRIATTITSGGNRNPAKADVGGDQERQRTASSAKPALISRSTNATGWVTFILLGPPSVDTPPRQVSLSCPRSWSARAQ